MIILIDNYDSFTYNLVHYFQEMGEKVEVFRNDEKNSDFLIKENPNYFVISPGPSSPNNAGVCLELIKKNSELKSLISSRLSKKLTINRNNDVTINAFL